MTVFNKIKKYITDPGYRFRSNSKLGLYNSMPDEEYLKKMYFLSMGKELNLDNPISFNEKIQWLKLHDRNPLYTTMVDKYEVKKYVAEAIGEKYIIPTIGVWDKFDDIDFERLPNQFVLKCTHDSGGLLICRDKKQFDIKAARRKINKCMKMNFYYTSREWPYKDVKPRIIAEQYMEDNSTCDLPDYKFFAFDGIVKALFVDTDRQNQNEETKFDFYDLEFKHLPFTNVHPNASIPPEKQATFDEMVKLAEILSKKIPQLRVDFYEVNGRAYFGELTFSHWSGMVPFDLEEWDKIFGGWIRLPDPNLGGVILYKEFACLYIHSIEELKKNDEIANSSEKDYTPEGLIDYKFFCFNKKPEFVYISKGMENHATAQMSFFDLDMNKMPFGRNDYKPITKVFIPQNFSDMKKVATSLAELIPSPFVRIDLYSINGDIKFSEITFSPCGGFLPFEPEEYDMKLGKLLNLDN